MFFIVSKLFWIVAAPVNALVLLGLAGFALTAGGWRRVGMTCLALSLVTLFAAVFSPLGNLMLRPLEDRFPRPAADLPAPKGIIVLGGGLDPELSEARDETALFAAGSRLTTGAFLARRYPGATLVFTGGSGNLEDGISEANGVERLWHELGVRSEGVVYERRSRNTWENATFTRDMLGPDVAGRWLLVTSAWHMPRSMGIFRKVGFDVIPYPVDYRTFGDARDLKWTHGGTDALQRVDLAVHEWIGLVAYRLRDRTNALFPGP